MENQFALILDNLYRLLADGTSIPFLAAGVVVITNLFKLVFARLGVKANAVIVALVVQVLVWVAYTAATRFGQGETFQMYWDQIIPILQAFIPLIGSLALGHRWYEQAKAAGNPILGYQPRTDGDG